MKEITKAKRAWRLMRITRRVHPLLAYRGGTADRRAGRSQGRDAERATADARCERLSRGEGTQKNASRNAKRRSPRSSSRLILPEVLNSRSGKSRVPAPSPATQLRGQLRPFPEHWASDDWRANYSSRLLRTDLEPTASPTRGAERRRAKGARRRSCRRDRGRRDIV